MSFKFDEQNPKPPAFFLRQITNFALEMAPNATEEQKSRLKELERSVLQATCHLAKMEQTKNKEMQSVHETEMKKRDCLIDKCSKAAFSSVLDFRQISRALIEQNEELRSENASLKATGEKSNEVKE